MHVVRKKFFCYSFECSDVKSIKVVIRKNKEFWLDCWMRRLSVQLNFVVYLKSFYVSLKQNIFPCCFFFGMKRWVVIVPGNRQYLHQLCKNYLHFACIEHKEYVCGLIVNTRHLVYVSLHIKCFSGSLSYGSMLYRTLDIMNHRPWHSDI